MSCSTTLSFRARMSTCAPHRPMRSSSMVSRPVVTVFGSSGKDLPATRGADELSGIIFQPYQEVQAQLATLDDIIDNAGVPGPTTMSSVSMARMDYEDRLEAAINEQINVEYTMSYIYHSLAAFMDRDNVGLPGFAAYYKASSDDERHHANLLIGHQNRRGGRVKLKTIHSPESEYTSEARGEALWSLELALGLEKLNFGKLRELHDVASSVNDAEMCHFLEDYLLHEQAKDVKKAADLVSRARRAGPGLGVFEVDLMLQREYGYGLDGDGAGAAGNGA
ncbi:ferritin [Scenedesmus sp. NREL 46B-D3]|nr:ferritin [Scenedesmus sp. NREL 46B-D3]